MSEAESSEILVECGNCGEVYGMKSSTFQVLETRESINCKQCGTSVEVAKKSARTLWSMFIVFYVGCGALITMVVALGNLFGYLNFSTYFVSVPYLIGVFLLSTAYKPSPVLLVASSHNNISQHSSEQ